MSDLKENKSLTGYEIAVIGMAGRFPGAGSIDKFWENLKNGEESVRFFSGEELAEAGGSSGLAENPDYIKAKAILEDVDYFDNFFFNYTLLEADIMDPQLRILHECSWKAMEDAGHNPDTYEGFIGFYVGASTHFYWIARMLERIKNPSENFGVSALNDGYSISTQVSYRLNLKGPAVTLQTACSTSLVAVHMACQALLSGECDMALAGGVSLKLPNKNGYIFQEGMVLSPDGHCRTFDAKAAGAIEGNSVGIVVLKPLENALKDRDHIYALVKGTAVNNDGNRKVGYAAPSVKGQAEVIRMAQQAAEVEPGSITYIEAHGTGTTLGDPVEIRALVQAFDTEEKQFCRIGSVKSNMGHLDAAAGVVGFIKTVLALYHQVIPPTLHFETPNPEIDFENSPFIVNTGLTDWTNDESPLRAGVSSFGIGGTNAHVVLEEWCRGEPLCSPQRHQHQLILLSAGTEAALERNTHNLAEYLKENTSINFADVVYTLQVGRKAFDYRRALVCRDAAEAVQTLSAADTKKMHTRRVNCENRPVVFMFSGLGSQYVNMGYDLYTDEPLFRKEMDRCFDILDSHLDYDMKEVLYPSSVAKKIPATCHAGSHLSLFIFEYALAKLLMKWGIMPYAMIGYSFGEYAAACIAGVFTLEDALKLIVKRGDLIEKTPGGAMLSVPLPREELQPLLPGTGELSLAIDNGPSCIVAGAKGAVDSFEKQLKQQKYLCMRLNTSHAIHSPLMAAILAEFAKKVKEISLKEPKIPYISNLTGKWITAAQATDPLYWVKHLARTVRFAEGIEALVEEPDVVFVELGPGRDLSALIQRSLAENQWAVNLVRPPQKEIPDTAFLLDRLSRLWLYGKEIDWIGYYNGNGDKRYRLPLPTYSFEKQKFDLGEGGSEEMQPRQPDQSLETDHKFKRDQLPDDYEAPRDEVETVIAEAFQAIFGLDQIGIHEDFFELGGDSLKVITLVTRLHQQLDVDIPMETVFKHPTVEEIAGYVDQKTDKHAYAAIPPVEEQEYYPLTPSQQRVFILDQIEEKNKAYNMPSVLWMEGTPDISRLEKACKGLMERHESLRTGFFLVDGKPAQKVYRHDDIEFAFEYFDLAADDTGEKEQTAESKYVGIIEDFVQPFDLSCPPLWRVGIVKVEEGKYLLMQNIHHIITDDISTGIMITELVELFRGEFLEEMPVRYKDYAVWQVETTAAETILKEQKAFWLNYFSGELPMLEMPCDYPRPPVQSFEGAHIEMKVNAELRDKLIDLARKNKTTLFVMLFTVYNILLYSYTGQEDIIVGTPITGRSHRDVQQVAGMFVNTLALRNHPKGNKTFDVFLREVKEETLRAFANQLYQFEDLVEQLDITRDMSRNPLFDTMFVLHTVDLEKIDIPGVKIYPYDFDSPVSKFDITLNVAETGKGLNMILEYSTVLFKQETMERFMDDFITVMETVVEHSQVLLDEIKTHPVKKREEEKKRILYEFNNTLVEYPKEKTLKELLEEQVEKTPDSTAVAVQDAVRCAFTYRELNEKSNQLAFRLRDSGAKTGTIIALMTDRTAEMIIGLLAVLKTGAAYLPIGPEYPVERVRYMVQHTEAPIILATESDIPFEHSLQLIDLTKEIDDDNNTYNTQGRENLSTSCKPTDLAYVIYTSGTTGIPKGVMIENRAVINFIKGGTDVIPFTGHDSILSLTTLAFDIFGLETLLPLTKGSTVVVGTMEEQLNAAAAGAVIEREKITILQVTPSRLKLFISDPGAAGSLMQLNYLLVGGEALPMPLLEKARGLTRGQIYNLYGPTETTIWSCIKDVGGENLLNIGKPMANTRIYIVSQDGRLQPIGVPGELCISGHGVGRGYFKDESLTREKFIENPFISDDDPDREGNLRLYQTGDLACWLPDGNIEFMGRIDLQVKIRGFRIEPEEIEHRLVKHEAIKEAVVLAKEEENSDLNLWAYIVSGSQLEVPRLREYLAVDLPDYMIPPYFVKVEKIPLTPNGKVNRKALLDIQGTHLKTRGVYVPPQTDLEKSIVDVWKEMLELDEVGIEDNFFDLGGTSLKTIMTISRLKESLERDIPVVTMFRYPTIGSMANFLSREPVVLKKRDRTDIREKGRKRLNQKRSLRREPVEQ